MSQKERIDFYNNWPTSKNFSAENEFKKHLESFSGVIFQPIALNPTLSISGHISLSHVLDALESLPMRPDHAFDWTWKAFEHSCKSAKQINTTELLRTYATPTICSVINADTNAISGINYIASKMPLQTAEYLLKKIIESKPYSAPKKTLAKRLLLSNGNPKITSPALQALLEKLETYDYTNTVDRRNGASLIKKAMTGVNLQYPKGAFSLSQQEITFFLLSGLLYSFRNDRAHANAISPFKSSTAKIKTYAHCWYCFLLTYYFLSAIWKDNGYIDTKATLGNNFTINNHAFTSLFGNHLGK
ncbi:hypothetical protein [Aeromonas salmonicida]|uniref:hypothetical protein n=1 Tax=Aeromonas salmonicida TaxID=645 RepID=UPI0031FC7F66